MIVRADPRVRPAVTRRRLSPATAVVFAVLLLAGVADGAVQYAHRPATIEPHVAGTNAIPVQLALAAAAACVLIGIWVRRSLPALLGAPFSAAAARRLRQTLTFSGGLSLANLARAAGAVLLLLVLLYAPFRMGLQITSGLDPGNTVNAWGGPTYAGALLAHYLDAIIGGYAAAFLLGRILVPALPATR